jgi:hypothetical protein
MLTINATAMVLFKMMGFLFTATTPIKQAFYFYCIRVVYAEVKCGFCCGWCCRLRLVDYEAQVLQLPELQLEQELPVPVTL